MMTRAIIRPQKRYLKTKALLPQMLEYALLMSFVVNGIRRHVSESLCVCPQKALIYHHML